MTPLSPLKSPLHALIWRLSFLTNRCVWWLREVNETAWERRWDTDWHKTNTVPLHSFTIAQFHWGLRAPGAWSVCAGTGLVSSTTYYLKALSQFAAHEGPWFDNTDVRLIPHAVRSSEATGCIQPSPAGHSWVSGSHLPSPEEVHTYCCCFSQGWVNLQTYISVLFWFQSELPDAQAGSQCFFEMYFKT